MKRGIKYYGLLTTFNPHTETWYCFSRDDGGTYWSDPASVRTLGSGSSAKRAMDDYLSKKGKV